MRKHLEKRRAFTRSPSLVDATIIILLCRLRLRMHIVGRQIASTAWEIWVVLGHPPIASFHFCESTKSYVCKETTITASAIALQTVLVVTQILVIITTRKLVMIIPWQKRQITTKIGYVPCLLRSGSPWPTYISLWFMARRVA